VARQGADIGDVSGLSGGNAGSGLFNGLRSDQDLGILVPCDSHIFVFGAVVEVGGLHRSELELGVEGDFNQGMDARLVTEEIAEQLSKMNIPMVRLAYDYVGIKNSVEKAIGILKAHKIRGRRMIFYVLHNYVDTPEDFFHKVRDLLNWGVLAYPMRYEPLCTLEKGLYVSPNWTKEQLDMVARARRVLGFGGAFPPYAELVRKFNRAKTFEEAFSLRPVRKENQGLPREGLREMALEHEIVVAQRAHNYFPAWRREENWRLISTGR